MKSLIMKFSNSGMTVVMLGIFVVLLAIAAGYPAEARFMPFVVGIPAVGLLLLQLLLDARERRHAVGAVDERSEIAKGQESVSLMVGRPMEFDLPPAVSSVTAEPETSSAATLRRELAVWGYFLGFIVGILLVGFWVAIPVFLVAFLRFQAKASWRTSLVLGLGASIVMSLVFERGLKVSMHRGFVVDYVLDRLER